VGIYGVTITQQVASYYNLRVNTGILVTNVVPRSPAKKAGVAPGDVILTIEGSNVSSIQELKTEINKKRVGDGVKIEILRGTRKGSIDLVIEGSP
jgi:S1-C subfamily serine protease